MENRRIDDLFTYLSLLASLRNGEGGHICTKEILEVIYEIRVELGIVDE